MQNLAPLILLVLILVSVISEIRSQGKRTGSSQSKNKRTFQDYARELMKQVEALDRDKSSSKPVSPVNTEEKTPVNKNAHLEPMRADTGVSTDNQSRQLNQRSNTGDQNRVQRKVFLEEKRKPKVNSTLKKRLNKTGLRQSVIMAEVLGPPRSKRSYSPPRH